MSVVIVGGNECMVRSHTSSMNALRAILEDHIAESMEGMYV